MITVSIVSHAHGAMVERLISQLAACPLVGTTILTRNIPESHHLPEGPGFYLRQNAKPIGFAANHNATFAVSSTPFFCVLNPDIELRTDPFPTLLSCLKQQNASLVAPLALSPSGQIEDSARHFPTPLRLIGKALRIADDGYPVAPGDPCFAADWVAGMFMLFRREDFASVGGFDESFFLYYEDVDICARLLARGRRVVVCPSAHVIHAARRDSHRLPRHAWWHAKSMMRYFWKHLGRLPRATRVSSNQVV